MRFENVRERLIRYRVVLLTSSQMSKFLQPADRSLVHKLSLPKLEVE